jgi:predicted nucleic acid-binding Zn ribbon protein
MQRISDDPVQVCSTCSAPVERVFHPVAVHFKGSGFYNTDYGTRKRAREAKESASSESSSNGKPESKPTESKSSDSKPSESKSEAKAATAD